MNTISSHLQRFSNKHPLGRGGGGGGRLLEGTIIRGRRLLNFLFLLKGALKRGCALIRGFTVTYCCI